MVVSGIMKNGGVLAVMHLYIDQTPIYQYGLTLTLAWISNHMLSKMCDVINYTFSNLKNCIDVKEWISNFIPKFILCLNTYPGWDEILSMLVRGATVLKMTPTIVVLDSIWPIIVDIFLFYFFIFISNIFIQGVPFSRDCSTMGPCSI